ncbi:MAG: hypothetical protein A2W31_13490 [Planctomycetes bacterium RBG_16_64_10]|nr:MAG: hypothetical protein A2W31_13490 [Planctomycetes bacterium RBG_16_64_10]
MVPFLTEEVWQLLARLAPERGLPAPQTAAASVMIAPWPEVQAEHQDAAIEARFARFQAVLGGLREIRSRQNIPPKQPLRAWIRCDHHTADQLRPMEPYFESMAGVATVAWGPEVPPPALCATASLPAAEIFVDLQDFIDVDAEIARQTKEQHKIVALIAGKEKQLADQRFVSRAPAAVVERERASLAQLAEQLAAVRAALVELRKGP